MIEKNLNFVNSFLTIIISPLFKINAHLMQEALNEQSLQTK